MTAQDSQPSDLSAYLWNPRITPADLGEPKQYYEQVFEQYKIYVETAEQVSSRRNTANAFFLTLHTLLLTAIGLFYQEGNRFDPSWLIGGPVIAALVICYIWWRLVKSYQQLNNAKFKVIQAFEDHLPARPFVETEWKILGEGKVRQIYWPLTGLESVVPFVFGALYLFGSLALSFF